MPIPPLVFFVIALIGLPSAFAIWLCLESPTVEPAVARDYTQLPAERFYDLEAP